MPLIARPLLERLNEKVVVDGDCLLFTGTLNRWGYGVINRGGRGDGTALVHRAAWELQVGPIPEGLELDHCCEPTPRRNCIAIAHLEPVTPEENKRRANARRGGLCRKGLHALPVGRVPYSTGTKRRCAECRRDYMHDYNNRKAI